MRPSVLRAEMVSMNEHYDDGAKTLRLRSHLKFTGIPNQIIEEYTAKIGLDALGLYAVIKKFADYSTGDCYPKIKTIAEITGVSRWTVMRKLDVLVDTGLILRESGSREGEANCYTFVIPQKADLLQGCSTAATGGVATLLHANKEELEPLNENQLTLSPPPSEAVGMNGKKYKKSNGKTADPRHTPFRQELEKFWKWMNPDLGDYYWSAGDAGQLAKFVRQWPRLDLPELRCWLKNYSESDAIIETKAPREFLPRLHQFANSPLNEYGKPREETRAI